MKKGYIAIWILCFTLLSSTGWAATVFVDAANDSGIELGTETYPFNTIVEGVEAAAGGDTVSVARGIYYGRVDLHPSVNIISQEGPEVTIIDGMGAGTVIRAASVRSGSTITVEGFTIRNGNIGLYSYDSAYIFLRNSIVRDCGTGVHASQRGPIHLYNTVVANISNTALQTIWNTGLKLYNVTIDTAPLVAWVYQTPLGLTNTTITNAGTVFSLYLAPAIGGSHENIWNYDAFFAPNASSSRFWLTDIMSADPLFVSPPDNYRLRSGSPLIDAGVYIGLPYEGAAPDIGAYEYTDLTEQVGELAGSIANAPAEIFRNPAEQRRNALYNKVEAVLRMVFSRDNGNSPVDKVRVLNGCLSKLRNDILQKTDGNNGGNPANDWITDPVEQTELYTNIMTLIGTIEEMIETLNAQ